MPQVPSPDHMIPGRRYVMISREDPYERLTGIYVNSHYNPAGELVLHLRDTVSNGHIYYEMRDHAFYLEDALDIPALGMEPPPAPNDVVIGGGAVAAGGGAFNAETPTLAIIGSAPNVGPIDIPGDLKDFADLESFEEGTPVVRITDPTGFIFICKQESLNSFWSSVSEYGDYKHPLTRAKMGRPAETSLRADFRLEKGVARLIDPPAIEGGGKAVSILSGKKRPQRRTRRKRRSSRRRTRRNNQHGI